MRKNLHLVYPTGWLIGIILVLFAFPGFSQECFQTRLHIQTDKTTYISGESIFFKAYVYTQFAPDEVATVLMVELTDGEGNLRGSGMYPIVQGVSYGSLLLSDSLKQQGYIFSAFVKQSGDAINPQEGFVKPRFVFNPSKPGIRRDSIVQKITGLNRLYFFPNSGKLITGIPNQVYVKSTTAAGMPIPVTGDVIAAGKNIVQSFTISSAGGYFNFIPQPDEKYQLSVRFPEGKTGLFALEPSVQTQVAIRITESEKKAQVQVFVPEALANNQMATLSGYIEGNKIFSKAFPLKSSGYFVPIPIADFPPATLHLLVQDANQKVIGFYSFVVNRNDALAKIDLVADTLNFSAGGSNVFTLKMKDASDPMGNVSVSIIQNDADLQIPEPTIFSSLLLPTQNTDQPMLKPSSQLQEEEEALVSFVNRTPQPLAPIDANGNIIKAFCSNPDSNVIVVKGTVLNKKTNLPVPGGELKCIFSNQDSGINILIVPIDNLGRFTMTKLLFQGVGKLKYELNGKNQTSIKVKLDSIYSPSATPVDPETFYPLYAAVYNDSIIQKKATEQFDQQANLQNTTLQDVVVEAKIVRPFDRVNKKYTRGLFQNSVMSKNLDFINDPPPTTGQNILDYLQGMITGLQISNLGGGNYSITSNRVASFGGAPRVELFLDEQMTTPNFLLGVPMREVALVKYFAPGTHQLVAGQFVGALCIYTKKWDDYPDIDRPGYQSFVVRGFYNSVSPESIIPVGTKVGKDSRTTLYWNPEVLLDSKQPSATLRFPNSANAKSFLIRIEGFTPEGKLIQYEKRFTK